MKPLDEINRIEKIQLLKDLQDGTIKQSDLTGKKVFVTEKRDDFFLLSMMNASNLKNNRPLFGAVVLSPDLKGYAKEFQKIMSEATKRRKKPEKACKSTVY